ncbi:MAG: GMC family oxidoreductase [Anaerolineae bacterium]|nr:MAG: GMC family oxidoreductase [Anaerolineae bacterium]
MTADNVHDYVIIGSGFGGSVSAMRLTEKGYSVLVLEKGKRFRDADFAKSNWAYWKYLWLPAARAHGILQISILDGMLIFHGAGVGGGSLGYANVLMEPSDELFDAPAWKDLADWKSVLRPHYDTARRMLGVATTPRFGPADDAFRRVAARLGVEESFVPTQVGVYFGKEGQTLSDPYFGGAGPERAGCIFCGGCMVGCRHNAKNTLPKNYLHFAERNGAKVWPETEVTDIRPLTPGQPDGARYEVYTRASTAPLKRQRVVRTRNVVLSAGVMGTLKLLFRCREETGSLPALSPALGRMVRTNSEALLGAIARNGRHDYSQGVAIGSVFQADRVTRIEPVRYPAGSGLMRFMAWPLLESRRSFLRRLALILWELTTRPLDALRVLILPGWAKHTTIMLVMQTEDTRTTVRFGRSPWTLFRRGLVSEADSGHTIPAQIDIGHRAVKILAEEMGGIPAGSVAESLFGMPSTAHILGGCPMGRSADDGVVDLNCEVFNYPGMYVVDGSIMPANPGINPSLTITALAEYAMSRMPERRIQTDA